MPAHQILSVDPTKKQDSMTGLVDSSDEHVLRLSLFLAARNPTDKWMGFDRLFSAKDPSTWSWKNLEKRGIQDTPEGPGLARLEKHAPPEYRSLVGSPISLLPLTDQYTPNIYPFKSYVFPTDKYELTHSKGQSVTFQLDRAVCALRGLEPSSGARAQIEMPEHSQAALQAVVDYLVTDELAVPAQDSDEAADRTEWGTWVEIVSIAAQWQLARMENLALDRICGSIDAGNCVEILIESTRFNLEALKKDCINYIVSHKEEVREKRAWRELTKHPEILLEVSLAL